MKTPNRLSGVPWILTLTAACGAGWMVYAQRHAAADARLWRHRNLGKAFYENPTTKQQAVEEFRQALALAPGSARDRLNYGLALLRAGDVKNGVAELERVQKQDPRLPHTWFNLGIAYMNLGDWERARGQFEQMLRLVPDEPAAHYQLGAVLKLQDNPRGAAARFEAARDLNPRLAAPHFQLYGLYRQLDRPKDAAAELAVFQALKKEQEREAMSEDMAWCAYAEIYDPPAAPPAAPPPPPQWREQRLADGFGGTGSGVAVLDLDGRGRPSLLAWSPRRAVLYLHGEKPVGNSGLESLRDAVSIAPGDFDNDGRPDLCVATAHEVSLYRNEDGRFRKHAVLTAGTFRKAIWLDFDHDYDQDLVLVGDTCRLFRNNGAAGFSDETRRFPFAPGRALDAVRLDLEPDQPGFDLAVTYDDRPGVLYRDRLGGSYEAVPIPALPPGAHALLSLDGNRDGRTDLAALTAAPSSELLLENRGGRFEPLPAGGFGPLYFGAVLADFSGRGRLERARISAGGTLLLARDAAADPGNWIEVALKGVKNPRLAWNAKVEVKAGAHYEKATYDGVPLLFRLGTGARVDTVRITWPNGLIQNETDPPVNRMFHIQEAPRLAGSCPMIFTWNGERFTFITDVLGVAPLGASSGDGRFFPVDHDEYIFIPGEMFQPRGGAYEMRITEELREVSYIDQLRLIALDHPATTEIVTNDKFKSPPFPEFRLFGVNRRIRPVSARDHRGASVREALLRRDRVYPASFRRDHAGTAELHHLDMDFGAAARDNRAVLVLNGWVDWADGSTFLAAMQAHQDLVFPYLQVKDSSGRWQTVAEDMGMPSGKPKTIAVDLTGKFLSASRQVRIVTNLCIYWDEIYLVEDSAPPQVRMSTVPLAAADLRFRGFSRATIHPERKQPETFDYHTVRLAAPWNPTPGRYTRYGRVDNLLADADDCMVIMGSGDEIGVRFDASSLPQLPRGWKRDFLLLVDGWAKDADANTAFSQTVLPLPFHAMSSYPYPAGESYPQDGVHAAYIREYLTRPALRLLRPLAKR